MARRLGPLISSWSFERSARELLLSDRNLIGAYSDEISRQLGETVRIERPRSVVVREKAFRLVDEQLPAILLICPGTVGDPERDGEGLYSAAWQMTVAAVAQSSDADIARAVASDLSLAGVAVLLQALTRADERVTSVRLGGSASDDVPLDNDHRSRAISGWGLFITVADFVCDLAGPPPGWDVPDPPSSAPGVDLGDLLTVETVGVTATPVEDIEP